MHINLLTFPDLSRNTIHCTLCCIFETSHGARIKVARVYRAQISHTTLYLSFLKISFEQLLLSTFRMPQFSLRFSLYSTSGTLPVSGHCLSRSLSPLKNSFLLVIAIVRAFMVLTPMLFLFKKAHGRIFRRELNRGIVYLTRQGALELYQSRLAGYLLSNLLIVLSFE